MRTLPGMQINRLRRSMRGAFPLAAALFLALNLAALTGCGGSPNNPTAITLTGPAVTTIDPGDSAVFTATVIGGPANSGVIWTLTGCTVSACGKLSNTTILGATYTAPTTVTAPFMVTVTATSVADAKITQTATLNVPINPTITTPAGALPGATFGTAYTASLAATGGISPYTWSISQGALPTGLAISSTTGAITGTPASAGTASFTVTLTDSGIPGLTPSAAYTITTLYTPLTITSTALPHGVEGTAYTATLTATGGTNTGYSWSVVSGTGLSAVGLTLTPAGVITGIPNAGETNIPVTVQVTDPAGNTATATFSVTITAVAFQGQVLSGTTPVNGATIQLYAAGATGNASAATPMLTQTVLSDGLGMFQLSGLYTCGQSSTGQPLPSTAQLYLVATGGTTSTTSTTSNPALTLVTAIGPCANLTPASAFTTINELTTVAAAWALAPFASSATNLGATATNTLGLTNAFLDATTLLANPTTGTAATLPANLSIETNKLSALADVLNTCATDTGSGCSTLFSLATPASGTAPTDTFSAALNITHNPGKNVAALFATISTAPPFAFPLIPVPNDWTMSLTVTGGGLSMPTALGIDSKNNIWVANQDGPLSAFNPQGKPLSATGYGLNLGVSVINQVYGLAIDPSDNVWVTNANGGYGNGSVTRFLGVNDPASQGTYNAFAGSYDVPYAIAADPNGDLYVADSGNTSATILNSSGSEIGSNLGSSLNLDLFPNAIALDLTHGYWLSGASTVAHFSSTGALLGNITCCGQSFGMATDAAGNLWVADYLNSAGTGAIAEIVTNSSGVSTAAISGQTSGGINHPQSVAVDAAQNVWFSNFGGAGSITELAGSTSPIPGAPLSPSTGVHGTGGYGLDSGIKGPFTLLPDRSGNLWVSNESLPTLTMLFGIAAPTITPLQPAPTAP